MLAGSVKAQQQLPAQFRDFSGGLNNNSPAINLEANESPNLFDVIIDEPPGVLKTRNGFIQCGVIPSGNTPTYLFEYFKSDGTRRLIVTDNQNYYQTADCITYTTIKTGLSSTANPSMRTVRDKVWIANKSTDVFTWNSTTAVLLNGTANTPSPAPPKCTYLEFWKERVWCGNSSSNPSGVAFSALNDSNGNDLDPSTGTASWPAANLIQVDQNGGSPIYGIKAYRDNLFVFKDNGIWKILFENEFNVSVVKTLSSVGSRFNSSIIENDGLIYFVGKDGLYVFDGDQSVRISDNILPTFETIAQPLVNNQFKTWTTNADFGAGVVFTRVDTNTVTGSLLIGTTIHIESNFDNSTAGGYTAGQSFTSQGSTWTVNLREFTVTGGRIQMDTGTGSYRISTPIVETTFNQQIGRRYHAKMRHLANTAGTQQLADMWIINSSTTARKNAYIVRWGDAGRFELMRSDAGTTTIIINMAGSWPSLGIFHDFDVDVSSIGGISVYLDGVFISSITDTNYSTGTSQGFAFDGEYDGQAKVSFDDFKETIYFASGTFRSDKFDAVTVSSWSIFDVTAITNGVGVTYEVRLGTNSGAVDYATFAAITPGAIIPGTTSQTVIQYQITSNSSLMKYLEILDVTVNYTQGGSPTQNVYGQRWKNRPWFSVATGTSTTNNLVLVKTKGSKPAWVPYQMRIGPMAIFNDYFYAAASTHSMIYRMDYGTNDNGVPIKPSWESRDEIFGSQTISKLLQEIVLDYEKGSAASTKIGFSRDYGSSFTEKTLDMSGTGRTTKRFFVNGGNNTAHRFRIKNTNIDQPFKFYGLEGYALPYSLRER